MVKAMMEVKLFHEVTSWAPSDDKGLPDYGELPSGYRKSCQFTELPSYGRSCLLILMLLFDNSKYCIYGRRYYLITVDTD